MVYIATVQLWVCLWCSGNIVCLECRSPRFESSPVKHSHSTTKPPMCGIGPNLRVTERGPGEWGCAPPTFFEYFQRIPFPRDEYCPQVTHHKEAKCTGVYTKHGKIHFHMNVSRWFWKRKVDKTILGQRRSCKSNDGLTFASNTRKISLALEEKGEC